MAKTHFIIAASGQLFKFTGARPSVGVNEYVVSCEKELAPVPMNVLVDVYNLVAEAGSGKKVTKFSDRKAAERRVWQAIEYGGTAKPINAADNAAAVNAERAVEALTGFDEVTTTTEGETDMSATKKRSAKKTPTKRVARAKKVSTGARGRTSKYAGKKLYKLEKENPRRQGTFGYKSWEKLENGMKMEDAIAAGARLKDLAWDIDRKRIEVRG